MELCVTGIALVPIDIANIQRSEITEPAIAWNNLFKPVYT